MSFWFGNIRAKNDVWFFLNLNTIEIGIREREGKIEFEQKFEFEQKKIFFF